MGADLERRESELLVDGQVSARGHYFKKIIVWLEQAVYFFNYIPYQLVKVILFLLMLLTTADVLGRYFFKQPILGTFELTGLSLVVIISLSLGWTQMKKEHIMIDFLINKLSWKLREIMQAVFSLILFTLLLMAMWMSVKNGLLIAKSNQLSSDLKLPMYLFRMLTGLGLLLFSLTILVDFLKSLLRLVQANES